MPGLLYMLFMFGGLEPQSVPTPPPMKRAIPFDKTSQWLWTKETWTTEGDTPLRVWREQLEARYLAVDIPVEVVEQYKQVGAAIAATAPRPLRVGLQRLPVVQKRSGAHAGLPTVAHTVNTETALFL